MPKRWLAFFLLIGAFSVLLASPSQSGETASLHEGAVHEGQPTVRAQLVVHPDDDSGHRIGVLFDIAPGWHIYWKNPGESGLATEVDFTVAGATVAPLLWPTPERFADAGTNFDTYGYTGSVLLHSVALPEDAGFVPTTVAAEVALVSCKDACIPDQFTLSGDVTTLRAADPDAVRGVFARASSSLPLAPKVAGVRVEPWMSRDGVRPSERVDLGWAIYPMDPSEALDAQLDAVGFFPEKVSGLKLEEIRVAPHPASSGALWVSAKMLASTKPLTEMQLLRGVLKLDEKRSIAVELPVSRVGPEVATSALASPWTTSANPESGGASWVWMLLFAFVGGLVLNLMPCVLPILALKSFAVMEIAQARRGEALRQGAAYTAGILGSMLLLAFAVVALRQAGTAVGWGFQLQEPVFLLTVSALLLLFALNLFGVFEVGSPSALASVGAEKSGATRSFFEGFLAVALATPCSAPFLGTAVGFAFTTGNAATISVFLCVGLGLAAPFMAISALPNLSRLLPKPGPWMVHLRTFLGFCLLGSVVWLLWVLGQVTAVDAAPQALVWLLLLSVCAWFYGLGQKADTGRMRPALIALAIGAFVAGPGLIRAERSDPSEARVHASSDEARDVAYTPERLAEGLASGRPVFVYFTADWCVTCKVNERRVLSTDRVRAAFAEGDYRVLRADMTRRDPELVATLARYGRAGVPLYLLFRPESRDEPTILPELLRQDDVLAELRATRVTTASDVPTRL